MYQTPVPVNGSPPVTVGCSPPAGASFPIGSTVVTCTATDALGRAGTCGFMVNVTLAPKLQKTRFMAFGDSFTSGVVALLTPGFSLVPSPTSYPGRLQVLLSDRYVAQTAIVDDQGMSGEKATDGVKRLQGLLRDLTPEVVLLLEGANDLNDGGELAIEPAASAMDRMVVASLVAGAVPFLATLPPQRPGGSRAWNPQAVPPYNARLATVAAFRHATLVDLYLAFGGIASTDLIGPDGMHPTAAGYQKMADAFFAAITAKLEVPAPAPVTAARSRKLR